MKLYKINNYCLFYKIMVWSVTSNVFFTFNSIIHFKKMDIKNVQFSFFDLRIVKKNAKNEFRP
jgi:hypothetical protein